MKTIKNFKQFEDVNNIKMIIVLETTGKYEDVDSVKVKLFTEKTDAEKYCKENTDNPMEEKYWKYCEIIDEGHSYSPAQYHNYA